MSVRSPARLRASWQGVKIDDGYINVGMRRKHDFKPQTTQDLELSRKAKELGQQAGIIEYINKLSSNGAATEVAEASTSTPPRGGGGSSIPCNSRHWKNRHFNNPLIVKDIFFRVFYCCAGSSQSILYQIYYIKYSSSKHWWNYGSQMAYYSQSDGLRRTKSK